MTASRDIWAVVPVKETTSAKQRLAQLLSPDIRQQLALAMLEDVLEALSDVPALGGVVVVTCDNAATKIAARWGADIWTEGAHGGHTLAVTTAARRLAAQGSAMLTLPGDVPLVLSTEISQLLDAHAQGAGFTIVPARDERGSNAIVCSPADLVPLRFGPNSYYPHLAAARASGISPRTRHFSGIALDIDEPADIAEFMRIPSTTRTRGMLEELCLTSLAPVLATGAALQ